MPAYKVAEQSIFMRNPSQALDFHPLTCYSVNKFNNMPLGQGEKEETLLIPDRRYNVFTH